MVYVDTSGEPLAALLDQPRRICLKINQAELAAGLRQKSEELSLAQVVEAGRRLLGLGAAQVVVTVGSRGVIAVTAEAAWQMAAPVVKVVSTVGSGDSLLAGLAVARLRGQPFEAALAVGVACGSANALSDLPARFKQDQVEALLKQVKTTRLK
jgi:fructose-1-phosphate kinase PfkB-like protein